MRYAIKLITIMFLAATLFTCKSSTKKISESHLNDTNNITSKSSEKKHLYNEANEQQQEDSLSAPGNTKLIFHDYAIVIHNFKVYDRFNDNGKLVYDIDSNEATVKSNKNRIVTLTMLKDTLHTSINIHSASYDNQIEVIPQNKEDRFKIEFSYKIGILGTEDVKPKYKISWYGMTSYNPLTDSSKFFFRLPSGYSAFAQNDVKKRFPGVRDTSIIYKAELSTEATIIYKNQPCTIDESALYLRIHRFSNGKLVDTKFIRIDLPYID